MALEDIEFNVWRDNGGIDTPIQTISARVRDLRKPQFGGHRVERRPHPELKNVFQYKLFPKGK